MVWYKVDLFCLVIVFCFGFLVGGVFCVYLWVCVCVVCVVFCWFVWLGVCCGLCGVLFGCYGWCWCCVCGVGGVFLVGFMFF
jgi:hypothetical protein